MSRLPGDNNNDGRVDFADVTAAMAQGLPFSAITETLAGMVPATPPSVVTFPIRHKVFIDPPSYSYRSAIEWGPSREPRMERYSHRVSEASSIKDKAIAGRVRPHPNSPVGTCLVLWGCTIEGDGGPWGLIQPAEWGGGVWFRNCIFRNIQSVPAGVSAFVDCRFESIGVDVFHATRSVYDCTVDGVRKPAGSDAHPDLWQQSWPAGINPGPLAVWGLRARNVCAQPFFARSASKLPAILLADVDVQVSDDCQYVSQMMREFGDVRIENVKIRRGAEPRPIQIRNDPKAGIPKTTLDSLTVIDSDVVIDPAIRVGGVA